MKTILQIICAVLLAGCASNEPSTQPADWTNHPANPDAPVPPAPSSPQLAGEPVAPPTQPAHQMGHHHHGAHK